MSTFQVERTRRGYPALWEWGTDGQARVICAPNAEPKIPLFIPDDFRFVKGFSALIPIQIGDYIIETVVSDEGFRHHVHRIARFDRELAICENIANEIMGEWDCEPREEFWDALRAAEKKALEKKNEGPAFIRRRGE